MNSVQKAAVSISICLALVVVFLQNPISGYVIEDEHPFFMPRLCTPSEKQALRSALESVSKSSDGMNYTKEQIDHQVNGCVDKTPPPPDPLPVSAWTSISPHVPWLGSVLNLIYTLATIAAMAVVVFFVFRTAPPRTKE